MKGHGDESIESHFDVVTQCCHLLGLKDSGMVPVKEQLRILRRSSVSILPSSAGIVPTKPGFCWMTKLSRNERPTISLGMVPCNKLLAVKDDMSEQGIPNIGKCTLSLTHVQGKDAALGITSLNAVPIALVRW